MAKKRRPSWYRDEEEDRPVSKSQKKREMTALQEAGEKLATLPEAQFAKLMEFDLPDELKEALGEYRRITSKEALRRQAQYIGKLMRLAETDTLTMFLEGTEAIRRQENALHKALENERKALLRGGDAAEAVLQALRSRYGDEAADEAARLAELARNEQEQSGKPNNSRKLYRHLRDIALAGSRDDTGEVG
ncbi:MAG: ribosome biogenesis factor YjgA [Oceanidesulfovibrio sp.]